MRKLEETGQICIVAQFTEITDLLTDFFMIVQLFHLDYSTRSWYCERSCQSWLQKWHSPFFPVRSNMLAVLLSLQKSQHDRASFTYNIPSLPILLFSILTKLQSKNWCNAWAIYQHWRRWQPLLLIVMHLKTTVGHARLGPPQLRGILTRIQDQGPPILNRYSFVPKFPQLLC